jgi:hypothetical protein
VMKDLKDLVSHLVVLKASQVALTAIPSKYPDGYRCNHVTSWLSPIRDPESRM